MRFAAIAGLLLLAACGDEAAAKGGTTGGDVSSGSSGGETTGASAGELGGSSTSSSLEGDASSSGGAVVPVDPPTDADFEWDDVEPLDCGDRGHVLHESGPPGNRVNLVILGDGYTAAELDTAYVDHVDGFLFGMFGPDGLPYDVYAGSFNICRIDVVSAESGTDLPTQGIDVDTAMDGSGDASTRLAQISVAAVDAELADALSTSNVEPDWVAVTLNTQWWIGSGGYPMLWSGGHETPEIGVHEAGHSFHQLADEYSDGNGAYTGGEPGEINVTADPRSEKWAAWLGYDQDDVGVIDFYEGARYYDSGIWRPSFEGRMRTVTRRHNAPSVDKIIRDIYAIARPVDDVSPKVEGQYPPALGLRVVDEALVVVDWEVDGALVLEDAGPRIWTAALALEAGVHEVTAVVRDPTTWVRAEDRSVLETRVTWPVSVPANLEPTLALRRSASPRGGQRPLVLHEPSARSTVEADRPHLIGADRRQAMSAHAELLRVRDALLAGDLADARRRLAAHAAALATVHATDRALLDAAIACAAELPGAIVRADELLARHRHTRFAKLLRRTCRPQPFGR